MKLDNKYKVILIIVLLLSSIIIIKSFNIIDLLKLKSSNENINITPTITSSPTTTSPPTRRPSPTPTHRPTISAQFVYDMTFTISESGDVHAKWIITMHESQSYEEFGFPTSDTIANFIASDFSSGKKLSVTQYQKGEQNCFRVKFENFKADYKFIVEFDHKNAVGYHNGEYKYYWIWGGDDTYQDVKTILPVGYGIVKLEGATPQTSTSGKNIVVSFKGTTQKKIFFAWAIYYKKKSVNLL